MERLVTAEEMKACDQYTIKEIGIPSMVLMERAAMSAAEAMMQENIDLTRVLVVCGTGNNGGDGLAIARLLHLKKIPVAILMTGNLAHLSEDCARQLKICQYYQIPFVNEISKKAGYTAIVDAIFGIGLARPAEGIFADTIRDICQSGAQVVAVDIPSGVSADTGAVLGTAVKADLTVTFAFSKIGLTLEPGKSQAGVVLVTDIGIYDDALKEK